MSSTKIFLVDDHIIVREGIQNILEDHEDFEIVGTASQGQEALLKLKEVKADILLTDLNMEPMSGIELVKKLKAEGVQSKSIALTMVKEPKLVKATLEAGVFGYVLKDGGKKEIFKAIETVMEGNTYFCNDIAQVVMSQLSKIRLDKAEEDMAEISEREMEILELILQQLTNKEIAEKLNISIRTVETHKYNLIEKTGSKNVVGLAVYAARHHLFDFE